MPPVVHYREIRPCAALEPLIESYWTLEQSGEGQPSQRVVPDGHPELILNLGQPFECLREGIWRQQTRCFLAGQIEGPLLLRPAGPARILGIRFRPHGAGALFGAAMDECAGRFAAIDDLAPRLARPLDEALAARYMMGAVEGVLLDRAAASRSQDRMIPEAVQRLTRERGSSNLSALAREFGISLRQFERRFLRTVGLPPKLFCRMQRFTHVFREIGQDTQNWAATAAACGYYDQSHLIRDFRSFSGEAPSALLSQDADLARHFLQRFGVSHSYKTSQPLCR